MHAWTEYIQAYLDARGMKPADLARSSGVSRQVLSAILNDSRQQLVQRPDQSTIDQLARAMRVDPAVLLSKVAEAMGLPTAETVVVYDASRVSNDELIRELASRLREEGEPGDHTAPTKSARDALAPPAESFDLLVESGDGRSIVVELKNPSRLPITSAVLQVTDYQFESIARASEVSSDEVERVISELERHANAESADAKADAGGTGERFVTRRPRRPDTAPRQPATQPLPAERSATSPS